MQSGAVVEIYHKGKRVASHMSVNIPGAFVTENLHMPAEHRQYLEWTPARIKLWGQKIGPCTKTLMEEIMNHRVHPEHGFRSCLGIIRLSKMYSPERVENACKRALELQAYNYKSVKSLLQTGLESSPIAIENKKIVLLHDNIRGNGYYREASHD